jgi:hypothetical protein
VRLQAEVVWGGTVAGSAPPATGAHDGSSRRGRAIKPNKNGSGGQSNGFVVSIFIRRVAAGTYFYPEFGQKWTQRGHKHDKRIGGSLDEAPGGGRAASSQAEAQIWSYDTLIFGACRAEPVLFRVVTSTE